MTRSTGTPARWGRKSSSRWNSYREKVECYWLATDFMVFLWVKEHKLTKLEPFNLSLTLKAGYALSLQASATYLLLASRVIILPRTNSRKHPWPQCWKIFISAYSIGDSVFVFAGINCTYLNSVERLKLPQIEIGAVWELIYILEGVIVPRPFSVVVPLNKSDIAVLRGQSQ